MKKQIIFGLVISLIGLIAALIYSYYGVIVHKTYADSTFVELAMNVVFTELFLMLTVFSIDNFLKGGTYSKKSELYENDKDKREEVNYTNKINRRKFLFAAAFLLIYYLVLLVFYYIERM